MRVVIKKFLWHFTTSKPAILFPRFLHDLVVSCLLPRIAPVRSVQVNRTQPFATTCQYTTMAETNMPKRAKTNMPKHGTGPPEAFSEIIPAKTCLQTACQKCLSQQDTKHAKSFQDTTCQTYLSKQASNMAAYLKASESNSTCSNITHALQCTTRSILVHQTCQIMSGFQL